MKKLIVALQKKDIKLAIRVQKVLAETVYKLKYKKDSEQAKNRTYSGLYAGPTRIADYEVFKDYVKKKPTDRLRTKLVTLRSISWNNKALSDLFGTKISVGRHGDLRDEYSLTKNVKPKEWAIQLSGLAREKGVDIKFE